jgi:hypothetical protein
MFKDIPVVHTPFLDHDLFDFLSAVDHGLVAKGRLHEATIRQSYPEFADIPYESKEIKSTFGPSDGRYYPQARREFRRYLSEASTQSCRDVKRTYLRMKLGIDLLLGKIESPWYMGIALYSIELQNEIVGRRVEVASRVGTASG